VELLRNPIRDYAWGSRSVLARMQGRPAPADGPEAELWIGAHPATPSVLAGSGVSLADAIAGDASAWLGADAVARFGARLPYLLKVLAADAPLSLQAHPDAERARERFAAGDPNYVDAHHKPELLVALTPFEALCGFRDADRSAVAFAALGLGEVAGHLDRGDLRAAVHLLLTRPGDAVRAAVDAAVDARPGARFNADLALVRRLAAAYPGDPGVLVALLLNPVSLAPGEAVWMPAGNLHAYLSGTGVEVMAASDNVLRGGLTPKRVDVAELLRVLRFEVLAEPVMKPVQVAPGVVTWPVPVDDFALHRVRLADGVDRVMLAPPGPRVVLCTVGNLTALDGAGGPVTLTPGHAAVGRAGAGPLTLTGDGEAFVASLGA
jgi:mannose-6-phosphate isomerase